MLEKATFLSSWSGRTQAYSVLRMHSSLCALVLYTIEELTLWHSGDNHCKRRAGGFRVWNLLAQQHMGGGKPCSFRLPLKVLSRNTTCWQYGKVSSCDANIIVFPGLRRAPRRSHVLPLCFCLATPLLCTTSGMMRSRRRSGTSAVRSSRRLESAAHHVLCSRPPFFIEIAKLLMRPLPSEVHCGTVEVDKYLLQIGLDSKTEAG